MNASSRIGTLLLLATCLAGSSPAGAEDFFMRPGAFNYLTCVQIASTSRKTAVREQELKTLIDRASGDAFGRLVSLQAYEAEYLKSQSELKKLATLAAAKNCAADAAAQEKYKAGKSGKNAKAAAKAAKAAKASKAAKPPKTPKPAEGTTTAPVTSPGPAN